MTIYSFAQSVNLIIHFDNFTFRLKLRVVVPEYLFVRGRIQMYSRCTTTRRGRVTRKCWNNGIFHPSDRCRVQRCVYYYGRNKSAVCVRGGSLRWYYNYYLNYREKKRKKKNTFIYIEKKDRKRIRTTRAFPPRQYCGNNGKTVLGPPLFIYGTSVLKRSRFVKRFTRWNRRKFTFTPPSTV